MFETLAPFIAYATALFIAAAIPGPGIAALVGRALGSSFRATLPFIFGLALGDVIYLGIAILGLGFIAKTFAGAFLVIKVLGGLYLLYIAWAFWTAGIDPQKLEAKRARSVWGGIASGFMVTMGNPKTIVFYMALVPNVIDLTSVTPISWAALSAITVAILYLALTPYALLTSKAKSVLTSRTALRRLNQTASVLIGGAGTFILGEAAWTARTK